MGAGQSRPKPTGSNFTDMFLNVSPTQFDDLNLMPVDDKINLRHCLVREVLDGNFLAPINELLNNEAKILEIGSGLGIWCCDMASTYKTPSFTGIDMFPYDFPTVKNSNVQLEHYNVLNGLPYDDLTFDYVSVRLMAIDIPDDKWPELLNECVRVLKVNGWIEVMDSDGEPSSDGPWTKIVNRAIRDHLISRKVSINVATRHYQNLRSLPNLSDITHESRIMKIGKWGGKIGELSSQYFRELFKVFLLLFGSQIKLNGEGIDGKIKDFIRRGRRKNIDDFLSRVEVEYETYKTYLVHHVFYAQKLYQL
ncbi:S-adenosyl-L-methionine-dependent methyltransferase [Gigaspora margarita]|uniref:S-adenosyl-L-methionine-dependent methyltransferase n=1 Tax=Gigaspora margarita TaxID=4874 RepID=A0A8H3XAP6_GIGMA|nr:S-adenosyl-L-methionine-dependent methyltransferase [Gigaspora margarita]